MTANTGAAQHRSQQTRGRVIKALPAVAAVTIAGLVASPANAAPSQPGVTSPQGSQPGVTNTPAPVAPAPVPAAPQTDTFDTLPGYTSLYDYFDNTRTVEDYNAGRQQGNYQAEPSYYYESPAPSLGPAAPDTAEDSTPAPEPAPAPVPTIRKPKIDRVETPEGTILVGADPVSYDPALINPVLARQISNTFQSVQADGGNLLVDNGFADAPRADRIAAGTAAGALTGAAAGFGTGLVPGAAITAGGAALGGVLGVAATPVLTPAIIWAGPIGYVFVPGAAALAGAGIGAAISAPIVATTTVIGAVTGGALGAAAAGGEATTIEVPAPAPEVPAIEAAPTGPSADQLPVIPAPLTTGSTPDLVAQANTAAASAAPLVQQAVSDANTWIEPAATAVQGFTSTVLEQPAVADAAAAAGPLLDQVGATIAGLLPA